MIIKGIITAILSLVLGPLSLLTNFIDMAKAPKFYFEWVSDVLPYFECLRYIIPLEELIPLFVAILGVTVIRIALALIRLFFGKVIPIW